MWGDPVTAQTLPLSLSYSEVGPKSTPAQGQGLASPLSSVAQSISNHGPKTYTWGHAKLYEGGEFMGGSRCLSLN